MTVLVCGDRNWTDAAMMLVRLGKLPRDTTIIHGAARGADFLAGKIGASLGFSVQSIPADWKKYGRSAGPIRNRVMLDLRPDLVIAFHPDLSASKGTADCVREALRRNITVEVLP